MFQDISTLFDKAECLKIMCDETVDLYKDKGITKIVGIESRGFLLASAVAKELNAGVVMCIKKVILLLSIQDQYTIPAL